MSTPNIRVMTIVCAETIREMKSVPSGVLYASLMVHDVSMGEYQTIIDSLKRAKLITEASHVFTWCGPSLS